MAIFRSAAAEDPTVFDRVTIQLSRTGTHDLLGDWGAVPKSLEGASNLLGSGSAFLAKFRGAGILLFLFGAEYGCCLPSLEIYTIRAGGPEKYFSFDEFAILEAPSPNDDRVATIAGVRCLSAALAPNRATYNPVVVYRLGRILELDTVASAERTRAVEGGFAGLDCRDDVVSTRDSDGTPKLEMLSRHE